MNEELYEIAFHCVGEGGPGGDAISVAYRTDAGFVVDVIDGGTLDSGQKMVEWIKEHYGDDVQVRNVLCTHGDQNHVSGLKLIFESFNVETLFANFPWHYTSGERSRELKEHFTTLAELEEIAQGRNILTALQGTRVGAFEILSPSPDRYASLVETIDESPGAVRRLLSGAAETALDLVPDSWETERLEEFLSSPTSPSNESSVVQFAEFGSFRVLLTGDAGVEALSEASDYIEGNGLQLPIPSSQDNPLIVQVPHHGSRHNISTPVLDRLLGEKLPYEHEKHQYAIACVGKDSDTHPRRKTTNAFNRRGCTVLSTRQGVPVVHPQRYNTRQAHVHPFYSHVEA